MSSYGVAVVIDVHVDDSMDEVLAGLAPLAHVSRLVPVAGPWQRVTAYLTEIEQVDTITGWLAEVRTARAAIAEDHDEFGALWVVLAKDGAEVRTVHRRYVLNADPDDPEAIAIALSDLDGDPRLRDVAGPAAAAAAALVFEVGAEAMVAAEAATAYEGLGTIGGPFPWWDALALPWPVPAG